MIVKLPRKCTGQEVIDAFSIAADHFIHERKRMRVTEPRVKSQYDLASGTLVPYSTSLFAVTSLLLHRWWFWGPLEWVMSNECGINIKDVVLTKEYEEVVLDPWYLYDDDQGGIESFSHDPASPDFAPFLPVFNEIMGRLAELLKPKST